MLKCFTVLFHFIASLKKNSCLSREFEKEAIIFPNSRAWMTLRAYDPLAHIDKYSQLRAGTSPQAT